MSITFTKVDNYTLSVNDDNINIGNFNLYTYPLAIIMPNQTISYTVTSTDSNYNITNYIVNSNSGKILDPNFVLTSTSIELYNNTSLIETFTGSTCFQNLCTKLNTLISDNFSVTINNNFIQIDSTYNFKYTELEHYAVHKISGIYWEFIINGTTYNIKIYNDYGINLSFKNNIFIFTQDYDITHGGTLSQRHGYNLYFGNGPELLDNSESYTNNYTYAIPFYIRINGDSLATNSTITITPTIINPRVKKRYNICLQDNIMSYTLQPVNNTNTNINYIGISYLEIPSFIKTSEEFDINNIFPSNVDPDLDPPYAYTLITVNNQNIDVFTDSSSYNVIDMVKELIKQINQISTVIKLTFTRLSNSAFKIGFDKTSCYPYGQDIKVFPIHVNNVLEPYMYIGIAWTYPDQIVKSYTANIFENDVINSPFEIHLINVNTNLDVKTVNNGIDVYIAYVTK